jgi:cytidylate kinase
MIVAVDGPSASGKGSLARELAAALDFAWLDTGLLYRAVGAAVVAAGGDPADPAAALAAARELDMSALDPTPLRREAAGQAASVVAVIPEVRAALLDLQRRFAEAPPGGQAGAVLDGRDIGTVVCPGAQVKICSSPPRTPRFSTPPRWTPRRPCGPPWRSWKPRAPG